LHFKVCGAVITPSKNSCSRVEFVVLQTEAIREVGKDKILALAIQNKKGQNNQFC
jgi:hypothetical protein